MHPSPVLVVGFLKSQLASSELLGVAVFDARFRDSVLLLSIRVYKRAAVMMSVNADVVELLIRKKNETPVELFSLDGHAHLRSVSLEAVDVAAYRSLTAVGS